MRKTGATESPGPMTAAGPGTQAAGPGADQAGAGPQKVDPGYVLVDTRAGPGSAVVDLGSPPRPGGGVPDRELYEDESQPRSRLHLTPPKRFWKRVN